jgi:CAAX protease family protein
VASPRAWGESFADSAVLSALYQTVARVVSFPGVYVIVWFWLRRYERRPFWTVGFERRGAARKVIRGTAAGVVMLGGAVAIMAAIGYATLEDGPPRLQGSPALPGVLIALIGWAVHGPAEAVVCRGWMLPVLAARYCPGSAWWCRPSSSPSRTA